jgi:hypothetical protein
MDFVVVPHAPAIDRCSLWLGAFDCLRRPEGLELRVRPDGPSIPLMAECWQPLFPPDLLADGGATHYHQVVQCPGLQPNRRYAVQLVHGEELLASASLRSLPLALPGLHEAPFTVLLGSCYCQEKDRVGEVAQSFGHLPEGDRPTVKILCGDQVYLDIPALQDFPDDSLQLAAIFLRKYVHTWRERDAAGVRGLGGMLKEGANCFASDDHEFWNNYPNAATIVQNTWTEGGRRRWRGPARHLFRLFQQSDPDRAGEPQGFSVPPASFLLLDTRFSREEGGTRFLPAAQMDRLAEWIAELNRRRWVGFLCIGQLLFEAPAGWWSSRFVDRNLADYAQYAKLVRILATSRQPLVILTGDVHYGRVAYCRQMHGPFLYEVVSSPMALVDPKVGGRTSPPPAAYPAEAIDGVPSVGVATLPDTAGRPTLTAVEHFLTLNLWSIGPAVRVQLKYWPVRNRGQRPTPLHTAVLDLVTNP